jgi:hypothetical protein
MEIRIHGRIITDWQGRYNAKESVVQKWMEKFLNDVALKYEIDMKHVDHMERELHKLEGEIKKFLKIEADSAGEW